MKMETVVDDVKYTCQEKSMSYTVIGDDIKNDFNFLKENGDVALKLNECLNLIESSCNNNAAFYFENGSSASDLAKAYDDIKTQIDTIKREMGELHTGLMTQIDNVNAELEVNFGHWAFYSVNEAGRVEK